MKAIQIQKVFVPVKGTATTACTLQGGYARK